MRNLAKKINSIQQKLIILFVISAGITACNGVGSNSSPTSITDITTNNNSKLISTIQSGTIQPDYAYVTNLMDNTISMYSVSKANGSLTPLNPPTITTNAAPFGAVTDPTGQYLYVSNLLSGTISTYKILYNGQLQIESNYEVSVPNPTQIIISQSGNLYITSNGPSYISSYIYMYKSDPNTGKLTYINRSNLLYSMVGIALNPKLETYLYALNSNLQNGYISAYKIQNGLMESNGETIEPFGFTGALAIHPSGHYVYFAGGSYATAGVYMYQVDPTSGKLSPLTTKPAATTDKIPSTIAIDQSGNFAYVGNGNTSESSLSMYHIDNAGILTPLNPSNINMQFTPKNIKVLNGYLYVIHSGGGILVYHIDPDSGLLTFMNSAVGTKSSSEIVFSKTIAIKDYLIGGVQATINGDQVTMTVPYNTNTESLIATFTTSEANVKSVTVNNTLQTSGVTHNNFTHPVHYIVTAKNGAQIDYTVTVTVAAKPNVHAYVTNFNDNTVSMYKQIEGGSLLLESTVATGINPNEITMSPQHNFAYVANNTGSISGYSVDTNSGILTHRANLDLELSGSPKSISFDPSGKHIYIVNVNCKIRCDK